MQRETFVTELAVYLWMRRPIENVYGLVQCRVNEEEITCDVLGRK
jgi:hypothetical protein